MASKFILIAIFVASLSLIDKVYSDSNFEAPQNKKENTSRKVKFNLGALIQRDSISQRNKESDSLVISDQEDFRRARLIAKLKLWDTRLRADYDFGVSEGWRNVYLTWRGEENEITVGQHTPPFSMENLNSSRSHVFLERSIVNNLTPGLSLGLSHSNWGEDWGVSYGVFDRSIKQVQDNATRGRRGAFRFTFSPYANPVFSSHFGLNYQVKLKKQQETTRIRTRAGSRLVSERLIDTGRLRNLDSQQSIGFEFLLNSKHFRIQGEHINTFLFDSGQGISIEGHYLEIGALFGSAKYHYSSKRGSLRSSFSKRGHGFELALRRAQLDLTDPALEGGLQNDMSFAFAWVFNRHYKLSINYTQTEASPDKSGNTQNIGLVGMRLQYSR